MPIPSVPVSGSSATHATRRPLLGCSYLSRVPGSEYSLCYPAHPAWDRISEIFRATFSRNGADPFIGRRLTELYRQAGLQHVEVEARAVAYPPGHTRRTIRLDLVRSMRPAILEAGLADQRELDELDRTLRQHLADPRTLSMPGLHFIAWGRKPNPKAAQGS